MNELLRILEVSALLALVVVASCEFLKLRSETL